MSLRVSFTPRLAGERVCRDNHPMLAFKGVDCRRHESDRSAQAGNHHTRRGDFCHKAIKSEVSVSRQSPAFEHPLPNHRLESIDGPRHFSAYLERLGIAAQKAMRDGPLLLPCKR
jgi:hypothetical protein